MDYIRCSKAELQEQVIHSPGMTQSSGHESFRETIMLYVFAQQPPTPDGIICPVESDNIENAVKAASEVLGIALRHLGDDDYTDGDRHFILHRGDEKGQAAFARHFKKPILFDLGKLVATPLAIDAMNRNREDGRQFLERHRTGDWGNVDEHDQQANQEALKDGSRIFSAYLIKDGTKIWIITEAAGDDGRRASTCILLPDEY